MLEICWEIVAPRVRRSDSEVVREWMSDIAAGTVMVWLGGVEWDARVE